MCKCMLILELHDGQSYHYYCFRGVVFLEAAAMVLLVAVWHAVHVSPAKAMQRSI